MRPMDGSRPTRRQWVIDTLCEAFARDQIGIQELEQRLEIANRVHTDADLRSLLEGIDIDAPTVGADSASTSKPEAGSRRGPVPNGGTVERSGVGGRALVDASQVPDRQFTVGFWSGRARKGTWIPARNITAIAVMGGVDLDFRDALFGPGVTHVHALAVMGGIDITVPPNVHVDTSGFAVMGAFEDDGEGSGPPRPEGPILRVTGFAMMGAVDVQVRLSGETPREAKRRKKLERRNRDGGYSP